MLDLSLATGSSIELTSFFCSLPKFDESQSEGHQGIIDRYDAFAAALQKLGLIGVWNLKPLLNGGEIKKILPNIPPGPIFREVMDEQQSWMTTHPCGSQEALEVHMKNVFVDFT